MSLIKPQYFPRSKFDYEIWDRPLNVELMPLSTLDMFDPFDMLDQSLCRNLLWIDEPDFIRAPLVPRVPRKYRITIDCHGYKPTSIKTEVSADKSKLIVSAKDGDEVKPNDADIDYSLKEFKRTYMLPNNVETSKMVSFVTGDGQLVVEFPLKDHETADSLWPAFSIEEKEGKKLVKMNFELPKSVDPAKVKVTCKDRDLIVQAEEKIEKPDGVSQFYYYQRSTLPEDTDFEAVKCTHDNHQIMIEAPCNPDLVKSNRRRIFPVENKQQQYAIK